MGTKDERVNNEIRKPIWKLNNRYEVSSLWNVRSVEHTVVDSLWRKRLFPGRNLTKDLGIRGTYYYVRICSSQDGINTRIPIHRLVAEAFIPNPNNLPCINHKDENKLNNCVDNLEWCTRKYNTNYGTGKWRWACSARNQKHRSTPILQYDLEGNLKAEYPSFKEAQRQIGHNYSNIWNCCNWRKETAYGFKRAYKNNFKPDFISKRMNKW